MSGLPDESPWRSQRLDEYRAEHRPAGGDDALSSQPTSADEDERYFVLWRGAHFFVRLSHRPYNNGHMLIIPYRRASGYRELTTVEQEALAGLIERAAGWLREALQVEGYNIGMNEGNCAESREPSHLRIHVVPRWRGDTNFMTAVNEYRVIPESLEDSYKRLRRVISARDIDA